MFKTSVDYVFDEIKDSTSTDYILAVNDRLNFQLFANRGVRINEFTTSQDGNARSSNFSNLSYPVDLDGYVNFPELGLVKLAGLSIKDAQDTLATLYSRLYNDPFVILRVVNNRVIVFPGGGGEAAVLVLENQNTTVIEALAMAGGLSERGNASKIKLMRRIGNDTEVYHMDLSTIEGIRVAQLTVQAYDIIYVQPTPDIGQQIIGDIMPYLAFISAISLLIISLK